MWAPVGSPECQPAWIEHVEEPGEREEGDDQAQKQPGADQHWPADQTFGLAARGAIHDPRLRLVAAQRKRGERFGADVEGEQQKYRKRQRHGAASQCEDQERECLRCGVGEDVDDELADVVVDDATRLHRGHDSGEVIVGKDHRGRLARDIGACLAHCHPDVGPPERGCVVDAVTGHRNHVTVGLQRFGDLQLCLG